MPRRIIRPADKVVQGNIEVICEGDEDKRGRNNLAVLIRLKNAFGNTSDFSRLLLGEFVSLTESFKTVRKLHDNTLQRFCKRY